MSNWVFGLIFIELLVVSWIDIKTKKISNWWFPFNLVLAIVLHFVLPESYPWELATLIFPVGWIVGGFVFFLLGLMGAGDSKYIASLFLIIPVEQHANMFERIIYSTIIVGLVFLSLKIAKDFQKIKAYALSTYWQGFKESIRSHFSYAPVILLAWLLLGVELWK